MCVIRSAAVIVRQIERKESESFRVHGGESLRPKLYSARMAIPAKRTVDKVVNTPMSRGPKAIRTIARRTPGRWMVDLIHRKFRSGNNIQTSGRNSNPYFSVGYY